MTRDFNVSVRRFVDVLGEFGPVISLGGKKRNSIKRRSGARPSPSLLVQISINRQKVSYGNTLVGSLVDLLSI